MHKIPFIKYHGAGNDFVLIDLRQGDLSIALAAFSQRVCDRRSGIGADGLLLLLPSSIANYRMRIFNADGSEPAMCGNGIRCLVDFIQKRENSLSELTVETLHGILKCRRVGKEIAVNLGPPLVLHWPLQMAEGLAYVVDTGVPHAVFFVDDLDQVDVDALGRKVRSDPRFAPHQGVNVNFVSLREDEKVCIRTYERGVEGETLACGTGAAAAAYVAMKQLQLSSPVSILTRRSFEGKIHYQQQMHFLFPSNSQGMPEIEMVGSADEVFKGIIDLST